VSQRGGTLYSKIELFVLGAHIVSFFLREGQIKLAHHEEKNKENLGGTSSNE
jgi:hypothetical protein